MDLRYGRGRTLACFLCHKLSHIKVRPQERKEEKETLWRKYFWISTFPKNFRRLCSHRIFVVVMFWTASARKQRNTNNSASFSSLRSRRNRGRGGGEKKWGLRRGESPSFFLSFFSLACSLLSYTCYEGYNIAQTSFSVALCRICLKTCNKISRSKSSAHRKNVSAFGPTCVNLAVRHFAAKNLQPTIKSTARFVTRLQFFNETILRWKS